MTALLSCGAWQFGHDTYPRSLSIRMSGCPLEMLGLDFPNFLSHHNEDPVRQI